MAKKPARYAATKENLIKHALDPAMRWLIATALDGTTMTYGDMTDRLEREANFSTVFSTWIGVVALEGLGKDVKIQSKPGSGARRDLMKLCPEPAAYELGFTQTERPAVIAIAEIRRFYRVHQNRSG